MLVQEIMTRDVITVEPRCSLEKALWIMKEQGLRRLPVTENGQLVGLLVQHDIEKAIRQPRMIIKAPVEWIMTRQPITVTPSTTVARAASLMLEEGISCLPVVDENRLVGIVTTADLLKILIALLGK